MYFIAMKRWNFIRNGVWSNILAVKFLQSFTPWNIALITFDGMINFGIEFVAMRKVKRNPKFWSGETFLFLFAFDFDDGSPVYPRAREEVNDLGSIVRDFWSSLHDGMEHATCDCWIVPRELIATMSLRFLSTEAGDTTGKRIHFLLLTKCEQ